MSKRPLHSHALFAASLITSAVACSAPPEPGELTNDPILTRGTVVVSLETERDLYRRDDAVRIRFRFENPGPAPVRVLKRATALEGFASDFLVVRRDGVRMPYVGKLVDREAPAAGDDLELAPGEHVSVVLDLERGYALDEAGEYSIELAAERSPPAEMRAARRLPPGPLTVTLAERRPPCGPPQSERTPPPPGWEESFAEAGFIPCSPIPSSDHGYRSCSNTQRNVITTALARARAVSASAHHAMLNGPSPTMRPYSPRYTYWFGIYSSSRWDTVTSNYERIATTLAHETILFDCSCSEADWAAFVYANRPYEIWLCPAFWRKADVGTAETKAGTLVHETSHWSIVAGTADAAYGPIATAALAQSSPQQAVQNADTYEHFANNVPALSMFASAPQPTCTEAADCDPGEVCRSGQCVASGICGDHDDCASHQVCLSNRCVGRGASCQRALDCLTGQLCVDGSCASRPIECFHDIQCGASAACIDNLCFEY